ALGDEFGVLHHIGGVADHARQDELSVGQLYVLPYRPLVLVTDVARLERVGLAIDRQHDIDDIAHRDVGRVRPCQLPQQRWKRMRSAGSPLMAWLIASTRTMVNF